MLIWLTLETCFSRPPFHAIRKRVRLLVKQREQDPTQYRIWNVTWSTLIYFGQGHVYAGSLSGRPGSGSSGRAGRRGWGRTSPWRSPALRVHTHSQSIKSLLQVQSGRSSGYNQVVPPGTIRSFLQVQSGRSSR